MGQPRAPQVKKGGPGGVGWVVGESAPRDLEAEVNPLVFCVYGNVCIGVPSFMAMN